MKLTTIHRIENNTGTKMKLQEAIPNSSAGAMQHAYKNAVEDILDSSRTQKIPVKKAYDTWLKQTTFGPKAKKEVWRIVKRVGK